MATRQPNETPEEKALRRIEEAERTGANALVLARLGLSSLPEAIGRLTRLTALDLSGNRLSSLPEAIGRLAHLATLVLSGNRLSSLPEAIGRLARLTWLNLSDNRLSSLPEAIGRLTRLTALDLSGNRLSSLPEAIGRLARLKELYLHANDALGLPPEVLGPRLDELHTDLLARDPKGILAFYFMKGRGNRRPLAEAKVLIVGEADVGKSSMVRFLVHNERRDANQKKTEKIDVTPWSVLVPRPNGKGELPVKLNVWDFGGQEVMHATHQFFLSKRSLYVVVASARDSEEQNRLAYWLKMVQSYGEDSPVLLAVNKTDDGNLSLNETRWFKDYGSNLRRILRVSCDTGEGIEELRAEILRQIPRLPHVFDELPESYFNVKTRLEERARAENFLEYKTYKQICSQKDLKDALDQKTLIRFLHDLGVVLNFDDPKSPYKLQETMILNPEWVTKGVYSIINDHILHEAHGRLTREHLARILPEEVYPTDKRDVVVGMMHKFELCFEYVADTGCWLVPELLSKNEPPDLDWKEAESLNFQYHYDVLPGGLICRFIVRMHRYLSPKVPPWRSGVKLDIERNPVLVRGDTMAGKVFITVQGAGNRRLALERVRHVFEDIHATVPGLKVTEKVPLPNRPDVVIGYAHLCSLEKLGEEFVVPEGVETKYRVKDLLNGVSTPDERDKRRRKEDSDRPPPEPEEKEDKPDILDHTTKKLNKVKVLIVAIGAVLVVQPF